MRIYYDTEFLEDGRTIELISIGMVAEDGREYYAVNRDMPAKRIAKHDWLMANVWRSLPRLHGDARLHAGRRNPLALDWQHPDLKRRARIADEVREFIQATPDVELWAWYGAYDHVVLCQLWGAMVDLPPGVPMFTHDLKQECARLGNPPMPEQAEGQHNALADARHVKVMAEHLARIEHAVCCRA
ncbi:MAG TPA: 3'-5' exoribonuclease [Thermobifida alba]|nr:3'-5' exoribonuclease [Thermobifida alba]